ncbi:uncharacterized protein LOC144576959 isoform X1 [Callithrix jacchus]
MEFRPRYPSPAVARQAVWFVPFAKFLFLQEQLSKAEVMIYISAFHIILHFLKYNRQNSSGFANSSRSLGLLSHHRGIHSVPSLVLKTSCHIKKEFLGSLQLSAPEDADCKAPSWKK